MNLRNIINKNFHMFEKKKMLFNYFAIRIQVVLVKT